MKADIFYDNAPGRAMLSVIHKTGALKAASLFMHTGASKPYIDKYIKMSGIDMTPFGGQEYASFAEFFARKKDGETEFDRREDVLISPCDSLLSVYPVEDDTEINMKGSVYKISDLIPDEETAKLFASGLCFIFRLEASDYHHFCAFDDCKREKIHFIPGLLHSVQPIACRSVPVYRLNRRWWSVMRTEHFGTAAQIEVGALLVGGVTHIRKKGCVFAKGEETGNFELAGSTIAVLVGKDVREGLELFPEYLPAYLGKTEVRVGMGTGIGRLVRRVKADGEAEMTNEGNEE